MLIPNLERCAIILYCLTHNFDPPLSREKRELIETYSGREFLNKNYDLLKNKIYTTNIRGFFTTAPETLVAKIIVEGIFDSREEPLYPQVEKIGKGKLVQTMEELCLRELEMDSDDGREYARYLREENKEERQQLVATEAISLLARYFIELYLEREYKKPILRGDKTARA